MPLTVTANGNNYNDGVTYTVESFELPEAAKTDDANRLESGSGLLVPDALADAPWSFTWLVQAATPSAVNVAIRAMMADFSPWQEVTTQLPGEPIAHVMHLMTVAPPTYSMKPQGTTPAAPAFAYVKLSGTRYGAWLGATEQYALSAAGGTIQNKFVNFPADIVQVRGVPGTTYGFARAKVTMDQASSTGGLAFGPTQNLGVTWAQHYNTSVTMTNAGAWYQIGTPNTFPLTVQEDVLALAQLHTNDATSADSVFRAVSSMSGSNYSGSEFIRGNSVVNDAGTSWDTVNLGTFSLPPGPVPSNVDGSNIASQVFLNAVNWTAGKIAYAGWASMMPARFAETFYPSGGWAANTGVIVENMSPHASLRRAYLTTGMADNAAGPTMSRIPFGFGMWMPPGDSDWVFFTPANVTTGRVSLWYRALYAERVGS